MIQATVAVKWNRNGVDNVPDLINEIVESIPESRAVHVGNQASEAVTAKAVGGVKNLTVWSVVVSDDAAWTGWAGNPRMKVLWWEKYDADGNLVDGNSSDVLTQNEFDALVSWLLSNGFDAPSLNIADTRAELTTKVVGIVSE